MKDRYYMGRKVSLFLILSLVLIGFLAAPVTAVLVIGPPMPNGDIYSSNDSNGDWYIYHPDTGIYEYHHGTGWHYESGRALTESDLNVTNNNANLFSNSLLPQTQPLQIPRYTIQIHGRVNGVSRFTQYIK
jgi:hypothetical protein